MSHEAPIYGYEWFQKVENALKEMRVGYDFTVVRDGVHGVFNNVLTFVSNHQSELLYSFSVVSLGVMAIYLLYKWNASQNALQSLSMEHKALEFKLLNTQGMLDRARDSVTRFQHKIVILNDDLEESRNDYNEMEDSRDFWLDRAKEVMTERDAMEEERDDEISDRQDAESDRDWWIDKCSEKDSEYDELQERVDTLEAMVDTYKSLVDELETTTELKLAA